MLNNKHKNDEYMEELLKYGPLIKYHISKVINASDYFDDVVQEVWVNLFGNIETLKKLNEKKLVTYIINTAKNTAINYKKKTDKHENQKYRITGDYNISVCSKSLDEVIIENEKNELLREKIDNLPQKDRDILIKKYYMDMDDKTLASSSNMKVKDVRVHTHIARGKLKRICEEMEDSDKN